MAKDEETKGGIIINVKGNPEFRVRGKIKRLVRSYVRLSFLALFFSMLIIVGATFWKDDLQVYNSEGDGLSGLNAFFSLENWAQWVIIWTINGWAVFEVLLSLALKGFVNNESAPWLKIWLFIYLLDCVLAMSALSFIIFFVTLTTKIVLGIVVIIFILFYMYFVNILLQFIKIISNIQTYEQRTALTT